MNAPETSIPNIVRQKNATAEKYAADIIKLSATKITISGGSAKVEVTFTENTADVENSLKDDLVMALIKEHLILVLRRSISVNSISLDVQYKNTGGDTRKFDPHAR